MDVFPMLMGLVFLATFIYPLIEQLVFIKEYYKVRKAGKLLILPGEEMGKYRTIMAIAGFVIFIIAMFSSGVSRIAFMLVGIAYILPIIMRITIRKNVGLYKIGIIQTARIILFSEIERIIIDRSNMSFINKKTRAEIMRINDIESMQVIEHIKKEYSNIVIDIKKIG